MLLDFLVATWPPLVMAALPLTLLGFARVGNADRSLHGRLFLTATLVGLAGVLFSAMSSVMPD